MLIRIYLIIIVTLNNMCQLKVECGKPKGSLVFVIDETQSMDTEINQVKTNVLEIFNTVQNSKKTRIEDFVLITFNDPGRLNLTEKAIMRIKTKDETEFEVALDDIVVEGGFDCEEFSLYGIEMALKESLPYSLLYVFTDAATKEPENVDKIIEMASEKQSTITFILTGNCSTEADPAYQVYYKIADRHGMVFNIDKDGNQLQQILNYIKTQLDRQTTIVKKSFPPGDHNASIPVDSATNNLVVIGNGDAVKLNISRADGGKVKTESLINTTRANGVLVPEVSPGIYIAGISSTNNSKLSVNGGTSVLFSHAFSNAKLPSLEGAPLTPTVDEKSRLLIELDTDVDEIVAKTVHIIDMDGKWLYNTTLELYDKTNKLYATESFLPPNTTFKVWLSLQNTETDEQIVRQGTTCITPQKINLDSVENKVPEVTIKKVSEEVNVNDNLTLECDVNAYPKPTISWKDEKGNVLSDEVIVFKSPYAYKNTLFIKNVNKNGIYTCQAINDQGNDTKNIEVKVKVPTHVELTYFDVVEIPKNTTIEYQGTNNIKCNISANPPVAITWYANDKEVHNDDHYEISKDKYTLTIKNMEPDLQGKYSCKAINSRETKLFNFKVSISGLEPPKIDKSMKEVFAVMNSDLNVTCRATGKPKPTIIWEFKSDLYTSFEEVTTNETLQIQHVEYYNGGTYKCKAKNVVNTDTHDVKLEVVYPPLITPEKKTRRVEKIGSEVALKCKVDGTPRLVVEWYVNGDKITSSKNIKIFSDHMLKFKVTEKSTGNYTCKASNDYGIATQSILIEICTPPSVEIPRELKLKVMVGSLVSIHCNATGNPEPEINWIFIPDKTKTKRKNKNKKPKKIRGGPIKAFDSIQVRKSGMHTCEATNICDTTRITYNIFVNAPPVIAKEENESVYTAVQGDKVLEVPCKVLAGNPEPEVVWKYGNFSLSMGTVFFDMKEDKTLLIKNIEGEASGTYECVAQNGVGTDSKIFEVIVKSYPETNAPTSILTLEEGSTKEIPCDVPKITYDNTIIWFKDKRIIRKNKLILEKITPADAGLYTCRVSSTQSNSKSQTTKIIVGVKPKFMSFQRLIIPFENDREVRLICDAYGKPPPTVTWWKNGDKKPEKDMIMKFKMEFRHIGQYSCFVKNDLGFIERTFEIVSNDCILKFQEFHSKQPLMLNTMMKWPLYETNDNLMYIPKQHKLKFICPSGFQRDNSLVIEAACAGGDKFRTTGPRPKTYKFSDLSCKEKVKVTVQKTSEKCGGGKAYKYSVGYKLRSINEVYDVCFDDKTKTPLYARNEIKPKYISSSDVERTSDLLHADKVSKDVDSVYKCAYNDFDRLLDDNKCCFDKRLLVSPRDVLPGLSQTATLSYMNTVPQWCIRKSVNWEDVERRVRELAKSVGNSLTVWTGASNQFTFESKISTKVPRYLWKVVQDPIRQASLAIIQLNIPNLDYKTIGELKKCNDRCNVSWMNGGFWRDKERGFTFCCSLSEFADITGYNEFNTFKYGKILD